MLDNIDLDKFSGRMGVVKPEETLFNFITKSGTTVETMPQFLIVVKLLHDRLGNDYREHITTTDSEKGTLQGVKVLSPSRSLEGFGGRYSTLTPGGLFSAAMREVEIVGLLDGAALMGKVCQSDNLWENPALMGAVLYFLSHTKRIKTYSFCAIQQFSKDVPITNKDEVESELVYLKGHSLNDVMKAEFEGTQLL